MQPQSSAWEKFSICLPHPYLTRYFTEAASSDKAQATLRITPAPIHSGKDTQPQLLFPLHNAALSFTTLQKGIEVSESDNTQWARSRRSPSVTFTWTSQDTPTIAQLWLLIYSLFTVYHSEETIRLSLVGTQTSLIREELISVGLAISHPLPINASSTSGTWTNPSNEFIILRSAFWQGAGSPFGRNSVWLPSAPSSSRRPLETFPIIPATQTLTTKFPSARIHTLHPIRPAKPNPGSTFYSRYIPHLDEHFSMVALDYRDSEHLNLFHMWQNDPRVATGWNETGDLEHHRRYLKDLHEDPHTFTMLAKFEDTPFAYFEVYWGKVIPHFIFSVVGKLMIGCETGRSPWRTLQRRRLGSRSPLTCRRRKIQRPT